MRSLEILHLCENVLQSALEARQCTASGSLHRALTLLDSLQHQQLPRLAGLEVAEHVAAALPSLRLQVQQEAMKAFNVWLLQCRERAAAVGTLAFLQLSPTHRRTRGKKRSAPSSPASEPSELLQRLKVVESGMTQPSPASSPLPDSFDEQDTRPLCEQAGVPLTLVYQTCNIHRALGRMPEFQTYYRDNRRMQASLLLNMTANSLSSLSPMCYLMALFFSS